jgi:hypothetical protein
MLAKYLILPAISLIASIVGVAAGTCKFGCASVGFVAFNVIYFTVMAFVVGLFSSAHPVEVERGPYTYYYREYQCGYHEAAMNFGSLFLPDQCQTLMNDKGVAHLGLYWDDPRALVNPNHSRSCEGFVLSGNASAQSKAIMDSVELKVVELPKWKAVEASMKVWVDMTYAVAPMKLIGPVFEYAMKKFPTVFEVGAEEGAMYELCEGNCTNYGLPVTEVRDIMKKLTPYRQPALTQAAQEERKLMAQQCKKTQ